MSLAYRIMYRRWQLASAQSDTDGQATGPLRNIPRTWYRLVRG